MGFERRRRGWRSNRRYRPSGLQILGKGTNCPHPGWGDSSHCGVVVTLSLVDSEGVWRKGDADVDGG